jgi:hypothetical protein
MPMDQSITEEFPILKGDDEKVVARLRRARKRLEDVFAALDVANDVIIVCDTALEQQNVDHDMEVCTVIRRYASNPIFAQLKKLHKIIVKLGGKTTFSHEDEGVDDTYPV